MDLSLVFCLAIAADLVVLRFIPARRRIARFVCMSAFFALETVLIVTLVGSPLRPVYRVRDLPREFWLQILVCCWWGLAARELISLVALPTAIRKTAIENKLLSDIIAASTYVCSALAMIGFVFGLPLQGLVATSGVIAIVLGLALQNTLGDVFSGLSLSIEKPYRVGDEILLEGGAEGEVVEVNWRSTHLRNAANDIVIVPNSAVAKIRIQNHSAGTRRYSSSLTVIVDNRTEPELTIEILKQAAMTCPSVVEHPAPSVEATEIKGDRTTYGIYFSTVSIASAGEARSQLITQLYKRIRPVVTSRVSSGSVVPLELTDSRPLFLFPESELLNHIPLFESLSDAERAKLHAKMIRHPFQAGDKLLEQGMDIYSAHFVFSGVVQVTRQVQDGRVLNFRKLGPGDSFGDISLLTGMQSLGTFTALTPGLLFELCSSDLKPILELRPELMESLSHSATKIQQFVAMFDKAAIQPVAIGQRDLLSRIRTFFHLETSDTN
jgi:small-conductance mechanosensitive channel/CRP-like cAMP-binding protein